MKLRITLFTILFCLFWHRAHLQGTGHPYYKFTHFTSQDGLPQNSVLAILQDETGFMWFGTDDGLARYDGYQFKVYRHTPGNQHSIQNNVIRGLAQDRWGFIWVATEGGGINVFDPSTEKFLSFSTLSQNPLPIHAKKISSLMIDREGEIWVATLSEGIYRLRYPELEKTPELGEISGLIETQHYHKDNSDLEDNNIWQLYQDSQGKIWTGTYEKGAFYFDKKSGQFHPLPLQHHGEKVSAVKSFLEAQNGNLWIGTERHGVFLKKAGNPNIFPFEPQNKEMDLLLKEGNITRFWEDKQGHIWIGTLGTGLFVFDSDQRQLHHYDDNPADPYSLNGRSVYTFYEDNSGNIWIGMYSGEGLNKISPNAQHFEHYRPQPGNPNSLSGKMVKSILKDSRGDLWVGIFNGGLNLMKTGSPNFQHIQALPGQANFLQNNNVQCLLEDREQKIWHGWLRTSSALLQGKFPITNPIHKTQPL